MEEQRVNLEQEDEGLERGGSGKNGGLPRYLRLFTTRVRKEQVDGTADGI